MDSEIAFTHRGDAVDDGPTATELLTGVQNVRGWFVFDCSPFTAEANQLRTSPHNR